MGDNYYNSQHGAPPGSGSQYFPPPPRQDQPGSRHASEAYPSGMYQNPQGSYSTYQPPREEQYRRSPVPPNMQVAPYRDEYGYDTRQPGGNHRHSEAGLAPPGYYGDQRSSSREGRRPSSAKKEHGHEAEKSVGATLLGGAAGAFLGHKAGKGGLSTVVGALAGAYGGHELEKRREKHEREKSGRRESESLGYGDDNSSRRRSTSRRKSSATRKRSGSRKRYSDSSDSESDDSRRRHHHRHH